MIARLLHDITQAGYEVVFTDDFEGMISITFYGYEVKKQGVGYDKSYIRHEHLSFPGGGMENLEKKIVESLQGFYDEVKDGGKPQKDGLADG